jgi:hypothetical protein
MSWRNLLCRGSYLVSVAVLVSGCGLFLLCLLAHVAIWRISVPHNDVLILFLVFLAVPGISALAAAAGPELIRNAIHLSGIGVAQVFVLHAALSAVYIASYPAAQAHSPTLAIFLLIAASPDKRLNSDEIVKRYTNRHTLVERVRDLSVYDLVSERDERLTLRPLAKIIIKCYIFYRALLGMPPGEG